MHLVALVESPDHVCCRYRLRAFRDEFAAAGHTLELRPWPRSWWAKWRLGADLGHADAVILQRRLLPPWQLHRLRRHARRLIFDLDDAVFLRDSYSPKRMQSRGRWRRFVTTVRAADAVVAGNDWLTDRAGSAGGVGRRLTIPTCVEPSHYPLAAHDHDGPGVQLVWVGSSSTLQGLEQCRSLLEAVGQDVPGLRLKLVCDRFLSFAHLPVVACPWSAATEAAEIATADIGISWLPDDDWSRGKCGLKVLQYMAAGLPVVANPVGVHVEMVRPGETGLLATTPQEWADAVARLTRDPALRRRMGAEGRRLVEQNYSVAAGGRLWRSLLNDLEQSGRMAG